jgi:hypothetical protein
MIGFTTRFAGDPPADDLTLAKGRGRWQRMLFIRCLFAVYSLFVRCYSAVLLAVIPSSMARANQGFCGEPGFDG